jgi:hypothetical protein
MSIENEIKKLRESIDWLTNAIIESKKPVITEDRIDNEVQKISISREIQQQLKNHALADTINFKKTKLEKEIKVESIDNINKSKEDSKITNDIVKQLGKEKMAAGVDRSKIKSIITSLAGPDASIADLDESNIEECYNKISELQPE